MSTVRLTLEVRNEIESSIANLFTDRWKTQLTRLDFDRVVELLVQDAFSTREWEVIKSMPAKWKSKYGVSANIAITSSLRLADRRQCDILLPSGLDTSKGPLQYYASKDTNVIDPYSPPFDFLKDPCEKLAKIDDERNTLLNAARAAMATCETLNQLVKIWPKAEEYVSIDRRKQLHYRPAKAHKERTVQVERVLDDQVRATLLKATLLDGGNSAT